MFQKPSFDYIGSDMSESIKPSIMDFNDLREKAAQGSVKESLKALGDIISAQESFVNKAFNPGDETFKDNLSLLSPGSSAIATYKLEANTQELIMKNEQQTKDNTKKLREQYGLIKKNPTKENMAALLNALEHNSNDLDATLTVRDAVKSKTFSDLKVKDSSMGSAINSSITTKNTVKDGLETLDAVIQTKKAPGFLKRFANFISSSIRSIIGTTQKPAEQQKVQNKDTDNAKDVAIKTALFELGLDSETSVQEAVQKRANDQLQDVVGISKSNKALKIMGAPNGLESASSDARKSGISNKQSQGAHSAAVLGKHGKKEQGINQPFTK